MVKYLDRNFFGQIDETTSFSLLNVNNVTNNLNAFNFRKSELLSKLSEDASVSLKRYARGEIGHVRNSTIYGLAQCTRDLSRDDCKKCVDDQIRGGLMYCCEGKIGGRVLGGSCNVRYEVYPFLN